MDIFYGPVLGFHMLLFTYVGYFNGFCYRIFYDDDIKMPVLDGLGMLQKIKDAGIEVQAVLLTGYSEFEYARKALQLQVVEYVLKPMDIDQFLDVLKKWKAGS